MSQFYLNVLLKEAGLSEADIETVDLSADDAGNAFLMREVDAAVTWEPWLTQGKAMPSTAISWPTRPSSPGLLVDCLVAKADCLRAIAGQSSRRWRAPGMRRCDYVEAHPDEANEIMARHVGGWLEDPAVFAETLKGVRFYDAARNREYFGTPDQPRPDLPDLAIRHRRLVGASVRSRSTLRPPT